MALNSTMPTIVKEMMNNNSKLTENLHESSKKLLLSLIETLRFKNNGNPGKMKDPNENQGLTSGLDQVD